MLLKVASLCLILGFLVLDLLLDDLYAVKPAEEVVLEVLFDHVRKLVRCIFTVVERVLNESRKFLVVILRIIHVGGASSFRKRLHNLLHVLRLVVGCGLRFLEILLLEVSMWLLINLEVVLGLISLLQSFVTDSCVIRLARLLTCSAWSRDKRFGSVLVSLKGRHV